MSKPFKENALAHFDAGWPVFPAVPGKKMPVKDATGVTGWEGTDASRERVLAWTRSEPNANVGLRMPEDVIALDVDAPKEGRGGGKETFRALRRAGSLPRTWGAGHVALKGTGKPSGYRHHFYRVPEGVTLDEIRRLPGNVEGVDILKRGHRLSLGRGSLHKDGTEYRFVTPEGEWTDEIPSPTDIPRLTRDQWDALVVALGGLRKVSDVPNRDGSVDVQAWLDSHGVRGKVQRAVEKWSQHRGEAGQRHDLMDEVAWELTNLAREGYEEAVEAMDMLRGDFIRTVADDRGSEEEAEAEWDRILDGAVQKVAAKGEIDDHSDDAYHSALNAEPVEFAREYVARHFTLDGETTLRFVDEQFWVWTPMFGHYVKVGAGYLRHAVADNLRGMFETDADGQVKPIKLKMKNVQEIVSALGVVTYAEVDVDLIRARGGVPFRNGWLDVFTGRLEPLTPRRFVTWAVPAEYDSEAECPEWEKFLDSIGWGGETEEYRLLRQWFGYLLSGDKGQQKMLLLHGPTRSGKGTILKIAARLLGDGHAGLQLDSLAGEFGMQALLGKSVATVGDARFSGRTDKRIVERLLSIVGDDDVLVNIKNKPQISTRLDVRLMLATNERPTFNEASDALARRFLIMHMSQSFLGREDEDLEKRLSKELAGICAWGLAGYADLKRVGHFSQTKKGRQMQEEFVKDSAPVRYFVEECCDLASADDVPMTAYKVTNKELYQAYDMWARNGNMYVLNSVHFARELLTAFEGQISEGKSGGTKIKKGIRLKV